MCVGARRIGFPSKVPQKSNRNCLEVFVGTGQVGQPSKWWGLKTANLLDKGGSSSSSSQKSAARASRASIQQTAATASCLSTGKLMAKTTNKFHAAMLQQRQQHETGKGGSNSSRQGRATELDVEENCLPV